jgi:hypothetical protein
MQVKRVGFVGFVATLLIGSCGKLQIDCLLVKIVLGVLKIHKLEPCVAPSQGKDPGGEEAFGG